MPIAGAGQKFGTASAGMVVAHAAIQSRTVFANCIEGTDPAFTSPSQCFAASGKRRRQPSGAKYARRRVIWIGKAEATPIRQRLSIFLMLSAMVFMALIDARLKSL
jgi:hypothetical protein